MSLLSLRRFLTLGGRFFKVDMMLRDNLKQNLFPFHSQNAYVWSAKNNRHLFSLPFALNLCLSKSNT